MQDLVSFVPAEDATIEAMLDMAGLVPGETLLDVGCGDGRVLAAAHRRGAVVKGVELWPAMAQLARQRVPEAEVIVGDLTEVAYPRADVVTAYLNDRAVYFMAARLPAGLRVVTLNSPISFWKPVAWRHAPQGPLFRYEV